MRTAWALAGLIFTSTPALAGEPLLVPDFTAANISDLAPTYGLQERVLEGLSAAGFVVLTSSVVDHALEPGRLDDCAARPTCPVDVLPDLPARVAVVASVRQLDTGELEVAVSLYEQADASPVDEQTILVQPGDEGSFARELAFLVQDLFDLIGPGRASDILDAARLIDGWEQSRKPAPPPEPEPEPEPRPQPRPEPEDDDQFEDLDDPVESFDDEPLEDLDEDQGGDEDPSGRTTTAELLEGTHIPLRHVRGVEDRLHDSSLTPRDWYIHATPHGGRVIVELHGGAGIGDTDRHADMRVSLDADNVVLSQWYQEGPTAQTRARGGGAIGYAPNAWVDIMVGGGIQYGEKTLTTGFTKEGGEERSGEAPAASAIQGYVQFYLRVYVVPVGPAKPYLKVGGGVTLFDGYFIDQSQVAYPDIPGGWTAGAMGGAGLLFDLSTLFGIYADGAYTRHFGARADVTTAGDAPSGAPAAPEGTRGTIAITGGLQIRI